MISLFKFYKKSLNYYGGPLILCVLSLSLLLTPAFAARKSAIEKILERSDRPTMAEVYKPLLNYEFPQDIPVNSKWALKNGYDQRIKIKSWTKILISYAPFLIATLEKAYPGATWVFIGRDGAAFADIFEAFYLALGQENRVLRLGISKASLNKVRSKQILDHLKAEGFDTSKYNGSSSLVFIDPVSKGNGRQGRLILSYIYEYLMKKKKMQLKDIIRKINLAGLIVSTHPGNYYTITNPENYYQQQDQLIDNGNLQGSDYNSIFNTHNFMSVDMAANAANEAGYTHFIGAWHNSFGPYQKDAQTGESRPVIGAPFSNEMKMSVLWSQQQIWKAVADISFLKKVQKEAKKLGYEFTVPDKKEDKKAGCDEIIKKAA